MLNQGQIQGIDCELPLCLLEWRVWRNAGQVSDRPKASLSGCVVVTWGTVEQHSDPSLLPAPQQRKPSTSRISGKLQSMSSRLNRSQAVGVLSFVPLLPKLSWEQSSKQNLTCYWRLRVEAQRCSALSWELRQSVRRCCSCLQASSVHTSWSCVVIPGRWVYACSEWHEFTGVIWGWMGQHYGVIWGWMSELSTRFEAGGREVWGKGEGRSQWNLSSILLGRSSQAQWVKDC